MVQENDTTYPTAGVVIKPSLSYRKLAKFFLPIGTTWLVIGLTHTITNAALTRLPYPELSLAVFTVIVGLTTSISGPLAMVSQVVLSLASDVKSFSLVRKYTWALSGLFFSILLFLGYTPAGAFVFTNLLGLKDPELVGFACSALRITAFLPLAENLRNIHQGLIISLEKTRYIFHAIILRFSCICLIFWWAIATQSLHGYMVGSLVWVLGLFLEGIFIFYVIMHYFGAPKKAAAHLPVKDKKKLKVIDISIFFLPLGLMMTLTAILQPVIQAGIARSPFEPIQALAVYGVARTLVMTLSGLLHSLHQCSIVYTKGIDDPQWIQVQKFCLWLGLLVSGFILLIALTPLGHFLIHRLMGLSEELTISVQYTMLAFSPFPIIRAIKESYWGALMIQRHTLVIAIAKCINIAIVSMVVLFFLVFFPLPYLNPAVVGALAFAIGEGVETFVIKKATHHEQ